MPPAGWRSLLAYVAVGAVAWTVAPGLEPLAGASPRPLGDGARALTIDPLAYGAATGRRTAPTDAVDVLALGPGLSPVEATARWDTLGQALDEAGASEAEAAQVRDMVANSLSVSALDAGTPVQVTLGPRAYGKGPRPIDRVSFRARLDLNVLIERSGGRLRLTRLPVAVDHTPLRIQGRVGANLARSARAAGAPAAAVDAYVREIGGAGGLSGLAADDRFDLIVEQRRPATGEAEFGKLLYAGLGRVAGPDLQLLPGSSSPRPRFAAKSLGWLQRPVPGAVSSAFGLRRHPILGLARMHRGTDFAAPHGTPILAASAGRVSAAGWNGGHGNQVRLAHSGGLSTSYSHMSRILARPGQQVRQGQVIGYVGSTGLSTGPHLHYEVHRDGAAVNPTTGERAPAAWLARQERRSDPAKLRRLLACRSSHPAWSKRPVCVRFNPA